jgi:hypothetical protein
VSWRLARVAGFTVGILAVGYGSRAALVVVLFGIVYLLELLAADVAADDLDILTALEKLQREDREP